MCGWLGVCEGKREGGRGLELGASVKRLLYNSGHGKEFFSPIFLSLFFLVGLGVLKTVARLHYISSLLQKCAMEMSSCILDIGVSSNV